MEWIVKIAVICVVTALTALLLERDTPELALLLVLAAVVVVMACAFSFFGEVEDLLRELLERTGLDGALFLPILKIIAISLVTRLGGDVCRDGGQKALASAMDVAGALCALLAARPLLTEALDVLVQLGGIA